MPWFVESLSEVLGPYSDAEFKRLAATNFIDSESLVSQSNAGPWRPASKVKGLFIASADASSNNTRLRARYMNIPSINTYIDNLIIGIYALGFIVVVLSLVTMAAGLGVAKSEFVLGSGFAAFITGLAVIITGIIFNALFKCLSAIMFLLQEIATRLPAPPSDSPKSN